MLYEVITDTMANVKAIKNTPIQPPILLALLSRALLHEAGSVNSKYPKNEIAKTKKMIKKRIFKVTLVDTLLRNSRNNFV